MSPPEGLDPSYRASVEGIIRDQVEELTEQIQNEQFVDGDWYLRQLGRLATLAALYRGPAEVEDRFLEQAGNAYGGEYWLAACQIRSEHYLHTSRSTSGVLDLDRLEKSWQDLQDALTEVDLLFDLLAKEGNHEIAPGITSSHQRSIILWYLDMALGLNLPQQAAKALDLYGEPERFDEQLYEIAQHSLPYPEIRERIFRYYLPINERADRLMRQKMLFELERGELSIDDVAVEAEKIVPSTRRGITYIRVAVWAFQHGYREHAQAYLELAAHALADEDGSVEPDERFAGYAIAAVYILPYDEALSREFLDAGLAGLGQRVNFRFIQPACLRFFDIFSSIEEGGEMLPVDASLVPILDEIHAYALHRLPSSQHRDIHLAYVGVLFPYHPEPAEEALLLLRQEQEMAFNPKRRVTSYDKTVDLLSLMCQKLLRQGDLDGAAVYKGQLEGLAPEVSAFTARHPHEAGALEGRYQRRVDLLHSEFLIAMVQRGRSDIDEVLEQIADPKERLTRIWDIHRFLVMGQRGYD